MSEKLRSEPRAFLLPHIASATDETRFNMSERCIANARAVLVSRHNIAAVWVAFFTR